VKRNPPWWRELREAVRELRLLLHRIFLPVSEGELPAGEDLRALEAVLASRDQALALAETPDGELAWRWRSGAPAPLPTRDDKRLGPAAAARIAGSIARSAADLLTSGELERIKVCDAHDCGWFFVDVSRNRSRRWCDMAGCGNRVKARRYRERHA
jgi:predicted RNA-binding Zn ribbon-like protein